MATHDDLNTPVIAVVGLIGVLIVVGIIVLLMVVFHQVLAREQFAKDVNQPYAQVSKLAADQQGRLADYGWVDEEKKIAHIPVERAMGLVSAELARDPNARVTGVADDRAPEPETQAKEEKEENGEKEEKGDDAQEEAAEENAQ